jgi:hypothetical protein
MPISSQSSTSSSVQMFPAAFGWPANGQPPSPPTVESNHFGPAAAHVAEYALDTHRRHPAHCVGQREIFDVGAGLLGDREPILQGRDDLSRRDVTLVIAAECRHHTDAGDIDIVFEVQCRLLFQRFDIFGVTPVQVLLGEPLGRRQRDGTGDRQLVAEDKRAVEAVRVEPELGVVDAFLRGKAGDDVFGVRPAWHDARADKRCSLDMVQAGLGKRLDQLDLVRAADRSRFDLEPLARALLVDLDMGRQIAHRFIPSC